MALVCSAFDGDDFQFRLTGVTEQAIGGDDLSIPFVEIRDIEAITPIRSSSEEVSEEEVSETTRDFIVIITAAAGTQPSPNRYATVGMRQEVTRSGHLNFLLINFWGQLTPYKLTSN